VRARNQIVWIDGLGGRARAVDARGLATGEVVPLNPEKASPAAIYHRTAVNDVARTEDLTYICTTLREDAGPTKNWMSPEEG